MNMKKNVSNPDASSSSQITSAAAAAAGSSKRMTWAQIQAQAYGASATDNAGVSSSNSGNGTTSSDLIDGVVRDSVFIPPKNQTGDGRTSLNDKYGY